MSLQLGTLVSWVAIAPGLITSIVSIASARRAKNDANESRAEAAHSKAAAEAAEEALALALRPIMAFGITRNDAASNAVSVDLSNTSAVAAVDITLDVSLDGRHLGHGAIPRADGRPPGTLLGEDDLVIDVDIPVGNRKVNDTAFLHVTARYWDERGLQQWQQSGKIHLAAHEVASNDGTTKLVLQWTRFEHGFPVAYQTKGTALTA